MWPTRESSKIYLERATCEMICKTYCLTRVTKAKKSRPCGRVWPCGCDEVRACNLWNPTSPGCGKDLVYGLNIHLCAWKKNKAIRGMGPKTDNIVGMRIGALQLVSKGQET